MRTRLFKQLALEVVGQWVDLAATRLRGTGIRTLIGLGNDDFDEMEGILSQSDYVELTDGRLLHLDDHHELLTLPYSNITPWHTNRELTEAEIAERLRSWVEKLEQPRTDRLQYPCPASGDPARPCPSPHGGPHEGDGSGRRARDGPRRQHGRPRRH